MFKFIKYFLVFTLIVLALISDVKTFKIKNCIVLPFALIGFIINFILEAKQGLINAAIGALLPIILLFILYVLRMLGAGDIKLFSAIGSIMGGVFILYTMAYSFIFGGLIAIIIILLRRNGKQRLLYLVRYLKACIITLSLLPYADLENKSDGAKFRFAYAIFIGALLKISIDLFKISGN